MLLQTVPSDETYIEGTPMGHHAPIPITRLQQESRQDGIRAMPMQSPKMPEKHAAGTASETSGRSHQVERLFQCLSSDDHHSDAMADRAKYSELGKPC
jgi:hypothetical protein